MCFPGQTLRAAIVWLCVGGSLLCVARVSGQDLPPVTGDPSELPASNPLPSVTESRLATLEEQNRQLMREMEALRRQVSAGTNRPPEEASVGNLQGQLGRPLQPGRDVIETGEGELPRARVDLSQGVRLLSPDGRYRIEFHDLTQVEGRFFSPSGDPLHNNFDIPRQRLYFTGQVDDHFDFYSVFNRGYGALDVLDAYVNFKFDKEFNIRVGRTKTPYTYEYYKIAEGDLIAPERSVFVGNLAPNRQIGVMAFGRLFSEQVEYAAGVFNGPHRSFQDTNNFKNPFLYVNTKPFLYSGNDVLKNLNLGGSANYGREKDLLEPNGLRTANDETTTNTINNVSPTFLRFNSNATEVGETAFWAGDMAWYYRSMTALAMYNGGYITYNLPGKSGIRVPYSGWSAAVTYFVTGEEITTRKEVEPLRDFNWRDPLSHPGAVEVYGRAAYINAGSNVFSSGLVDPTLWSNDATVYDLGCNWYLNRYVRIFADWQYASYGSRVQVGPDRFTDSSNMFWLRTQIYY